GSGNMAVNSTQSRVVATSPCAMRFRNPVMVQWAARERGSPGTQRGESTGLSRLLAQHHHNLTRLDAFVVHHHVRDCVACFLSTEAPRRAWVASSYARSRRASKPRTAPAFSVAATCTAPSRKSEPCGWSARRGCWCGPAGLLGCSSTPSAWGTSPHPVVPLPRPTPARPETPGRARSGLGDSLLGESPWGCRT